MFENDFKWDEGTNSLIRLVAHGSYPAGSVAGTLRDDGYIGVYFNKKYYMAHRIVWSLFYGEVPDGLVIDHIDRDRANNAPSNLRLVTPSQNNFNRPVQSNNKTGMKGVSFHKQKQKYVAQIKINGKNKFLGFFATAEEAREVYIEKARELHGEFFSLD